MAKWDPASEKTTRLSSRSRPLEDDIDAMRRAAPAHQDDHDSLSHDSLSYESYLRVKNGIGDSVLQAAGLKPAHALSYEDYVAALGGDVPPLWAEVADDPPPEKLPPAEKLNDRFGVDPVQATTQTTARYTKPMMPDPAFRTQAEPVRPKRRLLTAMCIILGMAGAFVTGAFLDADYNFDIGDLAGFDIPGLSIGPDAPTVEAKAPPPALPAAAPAPSPVPIDVAPIVGAEIALPAEPIKELPPDLAVVGTAPEALPALPPPAKVDAVPAMLPAPARAPETATGKATVKDTVKAAANETKKISSKPAKKAVANPATTPTQSSFKQWKAKPFTAKPKTTKTQQ